VNNRLYALGRIILKLFLKLFRPWESSGAERVPEGGAVLCGNHTAFSDPFYVMCSLGRHQQMHIMAKAEIMGWPVIGWLIRKAGVIGIKRGKSDVAAIKESMQVLRSGERLLLFPEGTRVKEGQQVEAHTGAAMLATRTGTPLLPIYISPRKKGEKVKVVFGEPYMAEFEGRKATPEELHRISADLMERIRLLGGTD